MYEVDVRVHEQVHVHVYEYVNVYLCLGVLVLAVVYMNLFEALRVFTRPLVVFPSLLVITGRFFTNAASIRSIKILWLTSAP